MFSMLFPVVLLSVARHFAEGHSWIDCFDTDHSKIYEQSASYIFGGAGGNGFCAGYGAGYPGRGDASIGTGYTYKLLKNEVEAGALVCANVGNNTYTGWRKRLVLAPGQIAYYAYLPNGHVVKDKKAVGTQHGVYWTGRVGTSLTSTHDMTPDHLLTGHTLDYDDGNCGETLDSNGNPSGRAGDGKPCIGSFVFPKGTAPGVYYLVWYWTFWLDNPGAYKDPKMARGYFGAAYSTCFEVEVVPGGGGGNVGTTPSVAPPVGNPVRTAVPIAPEPLVAGEADLLPSPTPALTPPIVAASAPTGTVAEYAPIDTPGLPSVSSGEALTPMIPVPEAATPTIPVPEAVTPFPAAQMSVAAPMPAATTPAPALPASSGTVCRRRMRS